jgi:UDP-N-acetylglucosamine diphosphorylase/glucosamine-1-phosphate N-acetyltransferase
MSEKVAVVLAAGKGTRMDSDLPKVLVPVRGRPMIEYVLDALREGGIDRTIVVVGYRAELVREALDGRPDVQFALQSEQLGTGHAVMSCVDLLDGHDGPVLIVTGDSPMMQADSVEALLAEYDRQPAACILGSSYKDDPTGLGRILRNAGGEFIGIVEEKDASDEERRITEVNMSYYVFENCHLRDALRFIHADNVQGEYYLTDCPGVMINQGLPVRALAVLKPCESLAVNKVDELAHVEAAMAGEREA